MMRVCVALLVFVASASEKIVHVTIENTMSDSRTLYYARGSSSCWGLPGLAPQPDGSINVVPDETNLACTCSDSSCDYYSHLLMPLYLDSKLDIFHRHEELIGQVKFAGLGKKVSNGSVQWTYKCELIDVEAQHKISCNAVGSPDPSTYFKAYKVSLSDPSMSVVSQDTCSLYAIQGDTCGQSDLDCKYTKYAKLAEKALKDGTCASQGYTVKGSTTTKHYPVVGDITITQYTKAVISFWGVLETCSLYTIKGDVCGQSDINCAYVKYAKLAEKSLEDGTCASKGYTVKGSTSTKSYPVVGDITITQYTKPSILKGVRDTCSLYAIDGDTCGQSDIDCKYTKYAKLAEKALKDGTCASQGYTVKGSSTTKSYPVIGDITVTKYTKSTLSFAAWANLTSSTCNCFNTCLCRDWACCCGCNDCGKDPAVKPHCTQDMIV